MSQEIEIEYKTLLTEKEYNTLLQALPFPNEAIMQTNYYFETRDFALKDYGSALRIRKKNDKYTLTLKEPHAEGILETHDALTYEQFIAWTNERPIPMKHVTKQLQALDINETDLHYYGSLETARRTFVKDDILYVLDKSSYNNKIDYELEIEAPSQAKGETALQELLTKYPVTNEQSITKIERFFTTLR